MFTMARRHILWAVWEGGRFIGAPRDDDEQDGQHGLEQVPADQMPVDELAVQAIYVEQVAGEVTAVLTRELTPRQRDAVYWQLFTPRGADESP